MTDGPGRTWLTRRAGLDPDAPPGVVGPALLDAVRDALDLASRAMSADAAVRDGARQEALTWQQQLDEARADSTPYLSRVAAGLRATADRLVEPDQATSVQSPGPVSAKRGGRAGGAVDL